MKFVVDAMFGTLAKWLRILGFDTVFAKDMDDNEIMALAERDNRIIITRDKELAKRSNNSLFLNSDVLDMLGESTGVDCGVFERVLMEKRERLKLGIEDLNRMFKQYYAATEQLGRVVNEIKI